MMYVFALLAVLCCVSGLPIYVYGKRIRVWWVGHNLFKKLNMETTDAISEMG